MRFIIFITLLAIFRALPEQLHLRSVLCDVVHIIAAPGEKGHQGRNRGFTRMRRIDADYSWRSIASA